MPVVDSFEFADLAALDAAHPETDTMGAVSTWSIESSVKIDGATSVELAVVGTTGAGQSSFRTETYGGYAPYEAVRVSLPVWLNTENEGSVGIAFGFQIVGQGAAYVEGDGVIEDWTTVTADGICDVDGNIQIRYGAFDSLAATYDRLARFDALSIDPIEDAEALDWDDILLDGGRLYIDGVLFGLTRGGYSFDPQPDIEQLAFDGSRRLGPVGGVDEHWPGRPVLRGTLLPLGPTQLAILMPGSAQTVAGAVTTQTPPANGTVLTVGALLTNVTALWRRADGGYERVRFPLGLCVKWQGAGKDQSEVEAPFEIHARALTPGARLYHIDRWD